MTPRKRLPPGVPIHISMDGHPACGATTEGGLSPYFGFADCRACAELLRAAIANGDATLDEPFGKVALVLWREAKPPKQLI